MTGDGQRVAATATTCETCDETWAYDRVRCRNCGGEQFTETDLDEGELLAVTVSRVTPPGVREPNHLGIARFEDGVQVTAQLADEGLSVGDSVVLAGDYDLRGETRGPRLQRA